MLLHKKIVAHDFRYVPRINCEKLFRLYPEVGYSLYRSDIYIRQTGQQRCAEIDCTKFHTKFTKKHGLICRCSTVNIGPGSPHCGGYDITLRHTNFGRTPLGE